VIKGNADIDKIKSTVVEGKELVDKKLENNY
jgi:hypothetical protein